MGRRKVPLVAGCTYHVFNKSIAGFEIFRYDEEFLKLRETFCFYATAKLGQSYSVAVRQGRVKDPAVHGPSRIRLIAYCLMPTHFHLIVQQRIEHGIEEYLQWVQASYARYFNKKVERGGPLFHGRFGARLITEDGDLLHMTRYVHLNPTSAGLVADPGDWPWSSYQEYVECPAKNPLCDYKSLVPLSPLEYQRFAEDRLGYQRSLQIIKAHLMD